MVPKAAQQGQALDVHVVDGCQVETEVAGAGVELLDQDQPKSLGSAGVEIAGQADGAAFAVDDE